ncbi:centrosomal protein of 72 kDa-like [Lethenteron reissneri]|uniref:centrosomal protein of 72 kDa-like n=1 Tax=Lethenteron reissneri TaxID=7753 RepID=UPI002AB64ADF|nr:centrosomal protein of 72 kDa-like [Lethenteron reissneri]
MFLAIAMAPFSLNAMALTATEDWVRKRLQLAHDNLGDVRSLSLPGTYSEKVAHLGSSLKNFTRLKSLDLSRNSLVSLQGLEHLTLLEKLNLYYNSVANKQELLRLRAMSGLRELDLRLNPVAAAEPDYRLLLVHMLPNLRRLDDRPVRDSERKAALMHYSSDQAYEFRDPDPPAAKEPEKPLQPRAAYVSSMSRPRSLLDADDERVLNLISQPGFTLGSKEPSVELHSLESIREMDRVTSGDKLGMSRSTQEESKAKDPFLQIQNCSTQSIEIPKTSSGFRSGTGSKVYTDSTIYEGGALKASPPRSALRSPGREGSAPGRPRDGHVRVTFADEAPRDLTASDPNLRFQDEAEAYHVISGRANFTPHPAGGMHSISCDSNTGKGPPSSRSENEAIHKRWSSLDQLSKSSPSQRTLHEKVADVDCTLVPPPLEQLLDLVDKHWNGSRSLHVNDRFLVPARQILNAVSGGVSMLSQLRELQELRDRISDLTREREALARENAALNRDHSATRDQMVQLQAQALRQTAESQELLKIKDHLASALKDGAETRSKLTQLTEESHLLREKATRLQREAAARSGSGHADTTQRAAGELQQENQKLVTEMKNMRHQLQQLSQVHELVTMLQESHKSLVMTNEHLLRELGNARERHGTRRFPPALE